MRLQKRHIYYCNHVLATSCFQRWSVLKALFRLTRRGSLLGKLVHYYNYLTKKDVNGLARTQTVAWTSVPCNGEGCLRLNRAMLPAKPGTLLASSPLFYYSMTHFCFWGRSENKITLFTLQTAILLTSITMLRMPWIRWFVWKRPGLLSTADKTRWTKPKSWSGAAHMGPASCRTRRRRRRKYQLGENHFSKNT